MNIQKPRRVRRSYVQSWVAPPETVFPLLCPVREVDWEPGWEPDLVIAESGVVEAECLFVGPGTGNSSERAIWIVTRHDPENLVVEMYKVTPDHTVGKLEIALAADGAQGTKAEVAFSYTSLGPSGDAFLEQFTEDSYRSSMEEWERALNHYLSTGRKLA